MYCSDKQFIEIAIKTGVAATDLYDMLGIISGLHARWGSLIKSQKFQDVLVKESPEVAKMISLLASVDKIDTGTLTSLVSQIDDSSISSFDVIGPANTLGEKIEKKLQDQFGDHKSIQHTVDDLGFQVAGDGWWYKRSLKKDLDKILY